MSFVTTIVLILFGLYIANSIYVIYHLFHVPGCEGNARKCLRPHSIIDKKLEVSFIVLGSQTSCFRNVAVFENFCNEH